MAAIITNKFRIHNSEQFYESFSEASPNIYYMMIGRPQAWATSTDGQGRSINEGSDSSPPTPVDNIQTEFYAFDDALAAKKIASSDVSYVIPRRTWTYGTVYDYYRHDYSSSNTSTSGASNLYDATFYVVTSGYNVYKCLFNNNGGASIVEPSGTGNTPITTGDDYIWKYMYTLSATQRINFLSTDFMAVSTNSTVQSAATDGELDIITVTSGGSSFTDGTHTSIPIRGDGSSGVCSVVVSSGIITSATVTTKGSGYRFAYITDADINSAGGGSGSGSNLSVIIPPKGGHGSNAEKELGAHFVMVNTNFAAGESNDFTTENDFRRVALLRDPNSGGSAASASTLRGTKAILMSSSSGTFTKDEKITQTTTGAVGKVVEWDSTNKILYYIQTRFANEGIDSNGNLTAFSGTNTVTGASSSATGTPSTSTSTVNSASFTSGYSASEIDADTGDILYIENRAPITRAADQTENVKLIVEF